MRRMIDIGPYFLADAGGRPLGQTVGFPQIPGMPSLSSGIPGVDLSMVLSGIPQAGIYTPWAEQSSDLVWNELAKPDFNVATFSFAEVSKALAAFGVAQPGFVAILSKKPIPLGLAEAAYVGTPYKLFSGLAVYLQDSSTALPSLSFLYWGQLRDPGDGAGGNGSVDQAAASVGGTLVFATEVSASSTSVRPAPPVGTFQAAFESTFGTPVSVQTPGGAAQPLPPPPAPLPSPGPSPSPGPAPPLPPAPPAPPSQASMLPLIGVGLVGAVVGFFLMRGRK